MNKTIQKKDWYRLKQYPHIGLVLKPVDRIWIENYVKNKDKIEKHGFFPFIHRKLKVRKFRKEICHDGTRSELRRPTDPKEREIYFANHLDSNIYSYYAEILSKEYDKKLNEYGISECVTAYRRIEIPKQNKKPRNKCNIDFANDVFSYIKKSTDNHLVAIIFDIKSFFDNLNHKKLKKYWKKVIQSEHALPNDHYNVFRNITKFSYIEENALFKECKEKILVERETGIKPILIKKKKYLREKKAVAYCKIKDIKTLREKGLIKTNKYVFQDGQIKEIRKKGIPQGSPISAVLANIYMLDFDKSANELLMSIGGMYRRYSDDMVAICKQEYEEEVIKHFMNTIKVYDLEIQKSKTKSFHFIYDNNNNRFYCFEKNINTKKLQSNTNFEYLGFQFDGFYTLLKNSSLSGYYRKMKRSIARGRYYTYHNKTKTKGELFKQKLYKRFTYLGSKRRRIYKRDKVKSDRFIITDKYDWGNYLSYAKMAAEIIPDNKISGQIKRHWKIFHELLKKVDQKHVDK